MTIAQAINGYSNGKLVIDKFVLQFVEDSGARALYRFVFDTDHLYLRKEEIRGFGDSTIEDIELSDADVSEALPEIISEFLNAEQFVFDIYKRDIDVPVEELLSSDFIAEQGLENQVFKTY